jgi:hypothetical protein
MVLAAEESKEECTLRRMLWLAMRCRETGTRPTIKYLLHEVGTRRGITVSDLVLEHAHRVVDAWPEIPPLLPAPSPLVTNRLAEVAIQPHKESERDL